MLKREDKTGKRKLVTRWQSTHATALKTIQICYNRAAAAAGMRVDFLKKFSRFFSRSVRANWFCFVFLFLSQQNAGTDSPTWALQFGVGPFHRFPSHVSFHTSLVELQPTRAERLSTCIQPPRGGASVGHPRAEYHGQATYLTYLFYTSNCPARIIHSFKFSGPHILKSNS